MRVDFGGFIAPVQRKQGLQFYNSAQLAPGQMLVEVGDVGGEEFRGPVAPKAARTEGGGGMGCIVCLLL